MAKSSMAIASNIVTVELPKAAFKHLRAPRELNLLGSQAASFRRLAATLMEGEFRGRLLILAAEYEREVSEQTEEMVRHLQEHGLVIAKSDS
jgi:hypothetical protein